MVRISFCIWTGDGVWVLVSGLGDVLFRISDLTLRYGSPACSYTLLLPTEWFGVFAMCQHGWIYWCCGGLGDCIFLFSAFVLGFGSSLCRGFQAYMDISVSLSLIFVVLMFVYGQVVFHVLLVLWAKYGGVISIVVTSLFVLHLVFLYLVCLHCVLYLLPVFYV